MILIFFFFLGSAKLASVPSGGGGGGAAASSGDAAKGDSPAKESKKEEKKEEEEEEDDDMGFGLFDWSHFLLFSQNLFFYFLSTEWVTNHLVLNKTECFSWFNWSPIFILSQLLILINFFTSSFLRMR